MIPEDQVALRRILMAVDATHRGRLALSLALELTAGSRVELQGLFVEDLNLLRLAGLPMAWEITVSSAARRRLELERLERALREQAEQVQKDLAQHAGRAGVNWSFRVVRGHLSQELTTLVKEFDLCIVGRESPLAVQRLSRLKSLPGRTVVALLTNTPAAMRSLQVAARLARSQGRRLLVLSAGGKISPELEDLRSKLSTEEWIDWPAGTSRDLRRALQGQEPVALVIDATHPLLKSDGLDTLLEDLGCPLLLVR